MWRDLGPIGRHEGPYCEPILPYCPRVKSADLAVRRPEQEVLELIKTKNLGNR
jgi:hypothetical protein